MLRSYESPTLRPVMRLPESSRRELLASLLLSGDTGWLYRQGVEILFYTESACLTDHCRRAQSGGPPPQPYRAELLSLIRNLLTAAAAVLREKGILLTVSVKGAPCTAVVFPRQLQFAIASLLRAVAQQPANRRLHAEASVSRTRFLLTVTADRMPEDAALSLCAQVAVLHGGRLLRTAQTVGFQFYPPTEQSADPRWMSPGIDGLLKDTLSCVHISLYSLPCAMSPGADGV